MMVVVDSGWSEAGVFVADSSPAGGTGEGYLVKYGEKKGSSQDEIYQSTNYPGLTHFR